MIRHFLRLSWNRRRSNGLILVELTVSFLAVRRIEDRSDPFGHLFPHSHAGHVGHRVPLQVTLASLPRDARQRRRQCRLQTAMVIAGNEPDTVQAALEQRPQKRPPMDLGLG